MGSAVLSNEENYTVFQYENTVVRFLAPYSLEYYADVREWDHGYIVVMTKYKHSDQLIEEYIDLNPILEDLYIEKDEFLKPIEEVRTKHDRCI